MDNAFGLMILIWYDSEKEMVFSVEYFFAELNWEFLGIGTLGSHRSSLANVHLSGNKQLTQSSLRKLKN